MERSFVFPSVFEENYLEFAKVADNFLEGIRIVDFKGKDYIVGNLALKEGGSPHKFLNSSAEDLDYQLLGLTGLLVATQGTYSKLVVTTGFPFTTYQPYRNGANSFFANTHDIKYDTHTYGAKGIEQVKFEVEDFEVLTEVDGCVLAIREGEPKERNNFFVASLGFGTFEVALSTPEGLVHRTTHSTKGMSYAVNLLEKELQKMYYLNLLTEQQLERAFQRGNIVLNRKRVNLTELRAKALKSYYEEVISPVMRKKFLDEDFLKTSKIYLAGGGAMYPEIVLAFQEEFQDILDIVVFPEPYLCACKGYCINSMLKAKKNSDSTTDNKDVAYVGLDLGNSNTVVTVFNY